MPVPRAEITIKRSLRARSIRLVVRPDGTVTVTHPLWARRSDVERFVKRHEEWIKEKLRHFASLPPQEKKLRTRFTKKHYAEHKEAARKLALERLEHFNKHYGFEYKSVSIKNTKTRWGSCSAKKNLNFNYKILFLAPEERDYVIVHELCHLKEMNHGPKFWKLVAEQSPNWKTIRKSIRKGL